MKLDIEALKQLAGSPDGDRYIPNVTLPKSELRALLEDRDQLPWDHPDLKGWWIVGMNHYPADADGTRFLYVAIVKDGRCITAEGPDDVRVFEVLRHKAALESSDG